MASSAIPFVFPAVPLPARRPHRVLRRRLDAPGRADLAGGAPGRDAHPGHRRRPHARAAGAARAQQRATRTWRRSPAMRCRTSSSTRWRSTSSACSASTRTLTLLPPEALARTTLRPIEMLVIAPSQRLDDMAAQAPRQPAGAGARDAARRRRVGPRARTRAVRRWRATCCSRRRTRASWSRWAWPTRWRGATRCGASSAGPDRRSGRSRCGSAAFFAGAWLGLGLRLPARRAPA